MWMLVLFSLVLAQGAWAEEDCSKRSSDDCVSPSLYRYIPQEVSEYNRLCPELPAFLKCLKDYQEQCAPDSPVFQSDERYDRVLGVFNELCEDGTMLNTVATENLRCLNETFRTTFCPEKVKAITGPFRSPFGDNEDEYTLPIEIMCLQDIVQSDCIAADIGNKCGQAALEATLEFIRRVDFFENTCGKENAKQLLRTLDGFNLDQQQKALLIVTLEKIIISAGE